MKRFILLLLVLVFACACTKREAKPRGIVLDRDVCARCGMQISDPRFAAQAVNVKDGSRMVFEEMGCGVSWLEHNGWDGYTLYVTDLKSGSWIQFDKAFFTVEYLTPMSYGIAALAKETDLEEGKTLITKQAAIAHIKKMNADRGRMHGDSK